MSGSEEQRHPTERPEQALVFAIDDSPVSLVGAFGCMAAMHANLEKVLPAFKDGGGGPDLAPAKRCAPQHAPRSRYRQCHRQAISPMLQAR
jgi:hypothetical protein